jgi:hypothetical protein
LKPKPEYDKSLEFLKLWAPEGPWDLVAIPIERGQGRLAGERFSPGEAEEMLKWLDYYGADHNLYFHVNPTEEHGGAKAKEEHVTALVALHLDVDPRDPEKGMTREARGEWLSAERERIADETPDRLPHPPSYTIDSGGGYQYYMRFEDPIPVEGRAEELKLYNRKLSELADGDKAFSIDHIMRLPGTLNRPDSGKRRKGRKVALARLVEFHPDRVYSLDDFTPSSRATVATPGGKGVVYLDDPELADKGGRRLSSGEIVFEIPESPPRLEDLNDLPEAVPDLCKVVIVQGRDPEDPDRWPSRSEALFFTCCALWRGGLTAQEIYGIITDPSWVISESVLDARDTPAYAHKQIVSSYEQTRDPNLAELNGKFTVISNWGGKCLVVEEVVDPSINRPRLSRQSFADFQKRFSNQRIQVGVDKDGNPKFKPKGKWWIDHPHRRQRETVAFVPGKDLPGIYNLWRGFTIDPNPGASCEKYLDHIRKNICRGIKERSEYLLDWMAYAVQYPDRQGEVAVVLRGDQGTGKGVFANTFGKLWGRHYMPISSAKHLTGSFNQHLRDCVVLFADEAFYAGDKQHEGTLKSLVTEPLLTIEAKGIDAETSSNFLHIIMASNEEWVVPANVHDRRFFILDVGNAHRQDGGYFGAIIEELKAGGYGALLHLLQTRDISKFDVRKYPETEVLQIQKEFSIPGHVRWWKDKLEEGRIFFEDERWPERVETSMFNFDYSTNVKGKPGVPAYLKWALRTLIPGGVRVVRSQVPTEVRGLDGIPKMCEAPRYFLLPTLEECRDHFDKVFGGPHAWPIVEEVDDGPIEEATEVY